MAGCLIKTLYNCSCMKRNLKNALCLSSNLWEMYWMNTLLSSVFLAFSLSIPCCFIFFTVSCFAESIISCHISTFEFYLCFISPRTSSRNSRGTRSSSVMARFSMGRSGNSKAFCTKYFFLIFSNMVCINSKSFLDVLFLTSISGMLKKLK